MNKKTKPQQTSPSPPADRRMAEPGAQAASWARAVWNQQRRSHLRRILLIEEDDETKASSGHELEAMAQHGAPVLSPAPRRISISPSTISARLPAQPPLIMLRARRWKGIANQNRGFHSNTKASSILPTCKDLTRQIC